MSNLAGDIVRSPQQITISSKTSAVRLGSYPAPYTILNLSTMDTVWIGDDTSVTSGYGIPLYPGGKTRRVVGGDVFAILDAAASASVTLVLAFTIDQWDPNVAAIAQAIVNSGTILIDTPIYVIPATTISNTGHTDLPSATGLYDVRTMQSVLVDYLPNASGHSITLTLTWYGNINAANSDIVGRDVFGWVAGEHTLLLGRQLPCRGSYLRVSLDIATAIPSDTLSIIGSHRPFSELSQNLLDRNLCSGANAALAAGATMTIAPTLYRYDGPAYLHAQSYFQPAVVAVNDLVTGLAIWRLGLASPAIGTSTEANFNANLVIPRNSWQVQLINVGAGNASVQINVLASPEST